VQEALTNVVKHAGASTVEVTVDWRPDQVEVSVVDDGQGLAGSGSAGHGLIGIRERVAAAGGSVTFGSPGKGFHIVAVFS